MKFAKITLLRLVVLMFIATLGIAGLVSCSSSKESSTQSNTTAATTPTTTTQTPVTTTAVSIHDLNTVYYVDAAAIIRSSGGISSEKAYDRLKFLVAIQGLLNRTKPQMFIELTSAGDILYDEFEYDVDRFWYDYLKEKDYMGSSNPDFKEVKITNFAHVIRNDELMEFIKRQGIVLWDKEVYATSNVASTVCGIDGYLPVLADGELEKTLTAKGVEVKLDLSGKFTAEGKIWQTDTKTTGSKKCDAYIWALEKYGDKVDPTRVGYLVDAYAMAPLSDKATDLFANGSMYANNQVVNHDYFIRYGCFVFDLSPFSDSVPLDDSGYGRTEKDTDYNTFRKILLKLYKRNKGEVGVLSGFTPWGIKYTAHTGERTEQGGLDGETTFVALANAYNFVVDADAPSMASLANASFYSHVKLEESYENPKPEKISYDSSKKYVHIYMGDYDGAAWVNRAVAKYFTGAERGNLTVTWAFNPNLSARVPQAFMFMQENRTDKDYFICGDSGAGYAFPDMFRAENATRKKISGLPDGMAAFKRWNEKYYKQFGLTITGFLLSHDVILGGTTFKNEITYQVLNAFSSFSPDGALLNRMPNTVCKGLGSDGRLGIYKRSNNNLYFSTLRFDIHYGTVAEHAPKIINELRSTSDRVLAIRSILASPKRLEEIFEAVKKEYPDVEFVDGYNYFQLMQAAYE